MMTINEYNYYKTGNLVIDFDSISIDWPTYSKDGSMSGSSYFSKHLKQVYDPENKDEYKIINMSFYNFVLNIYHNCIPNFKIVIKKVNDIRCLDVSFEYKDKSYTLEEFQTKLECRIIYKWVLTIYTIIFNKYVIKYANKNIDKYFELKSVKIINVECIPLEIRNRLKTQFKDIKIEFEENVF